MDSKEQYKVIGLMSGTSLDGVDVAYCSFRMIEGSYKFKIERALTVKYSAAWLKKLSSAHLLNGMDLMELHEAYGFYLGELCSKFMSINGIKKVDFISSHGHTVFHQPDRRFTFQVGSGNAIHAASKLPVISDFRSFDVAIGGEGAPLVPIGDRLLFSNYDVCLNLGGIANISAEVKDQRIAFDVCFVNMGLNYLASQAGKTFDRGGERASKGQLNAKMLSALKKIYNSTNKKRPSLGRELFEKSVLPVLNDKRIPLEDRLYTFTDSIASEIAEAIRPLKPKATVLCTGGGAFNSFLMYRIMEKCGDQISLVIPEEDIVKYKEALVFALLGVLRSRNEINCLKNVTGSLRDHSAGTMTGF